MHYRKIRPGLFHIEADGCIVNIREGLTDLEGRRVTSIEIIPDEYPDGMWERIGPANVRVRRIRDKVSRST